jgi:putative tryptophan/tyrosine transport system substrate-binding protein
MVADLALKYRLPTLMDNMDNKEFVEAGGLVSLGLDLVESYRRAATHVHKILKGADPANLPMEQPVKLDLVLIKVAAAFSRIAVVAHLA